METLMPRIDHWVTKVAKSCKSQALVVQCYWYMSV